MTTDDATAASSMASRTRRAGGECGGQVRRDGVAGADDIDRAAQREGGDVLDGPVGARADDPALGQGHEDGPADCGGPVRRGRRLPGPVLPSGRAIPGSPSRVQERGQLGGVHLEAQGRPAGQAATRVGEDRQVGRSRRPARRCVSSRPRVTTPVSAWSTCSSTMIASALGAIERSPSARRSTSAAGVGRPVLGVEPVQLDGGPAGLDDQRLAVGERPALGRGDEVIELHAGQRREPAPQLVALAVVAAEADRDDPADAERDQVVEDRPRAAGLGADARRRCGPAGRSRSRSPGARGRSRGSGRGRSRRRPRCGAPGSGR